MATDSGSIDSSVNSMTPIVEATEKPSTLPYDPDYVPSIFVFANSTTTVTDKQKNKSRWKRLVNRRHKNNLHETRSRDRPKITKNVNGNTSEVTSHVNEANEENAYVDHDECAVSQESTSQANVDEDECTDSQELTTEVGCISDGQVFDTLPINDEGSTNSESEPVVNHDKGLITDVDSNAWESLMQQISAQEELIGMLKSELNVVISPAAKMQGDDEQTHFYTGLPSYAVFSSSLDLFLSVMSKRTSHRLSPQDQFLLVLMKLRLAVPGKDLGYRFGVSSNRISQIFHEWINVMSRELKQLIKWPDRELIRKTLPDCFKSKYPRATCIIDCSEVFIERATSLSARSETYSNYKSHNTAKFLVAISPTGAIIFVSKCWDG